jgi:signal transduction histidine kinase
MNYQEEDVSEIVNGIVASFSAYAKKKDIMIKTRDEGHALKAVVDKDYIEEVLVNLVDNAIKFTNAGGEVKVNAGYERDGNGIRIDVSDNGIGIPKNKMDGLFTQFYQADAKLSRKYGGSGLGLYLSKGIVEAMGGRIWCESEVGKGTRFSFVLPKKPGEKI